MAPHFPATSRWRPEARAYQNAHRFFNFTMLLAWPGSDDMTHREAYVACIYWRRAGV